MKPGAWEYKTSVHTICTPEGVTFSYQIACPVTRFMAWAIDLCAISVISSSVGSIIGIFDMISKDFAVAASLLSYFIISIGYGVFLEWRWRGQTLGKRLLRLRVMDVQGYRLRFSQIVIRNLLRFADSLPLFYLVGGISCLISKNAQRLGDLTANTLVIRIPVISEPDLKQILPDKYNSLRNYPHLGARLRQKVTPQETSAAIQALLRRRELEPRSRVFLFKEIAFHFKNIVPFPPEASDGISDEQYVRNIVDILI